MKPLIACAVLGLAATAWAQQPRIDAPLGGWRLSEPGAAGFVQEVHYPASNVNVAGQALAAQIRGQIAAQPKPATLVVDGVAMPLRVEADGRYARPWSFGPGAHSVSVQGAGGAARRTFYEAQSGRVAPGLRVVLSWDSDMTDLDLHVIEPDGEHVFYGHRIGRSGGALDVDVTTGFGPEIYATPAPQPGVYHVFVNYFGAGELQDDLSTAQVAVVLREGTPSERQQLFRVPLRKPGELTLVGRFVVR